MGQPLENNSQYRRSALSSSYFPRGTPGAGGGANCAGTIVQVVNVACVDAATTAEGMGFSPLLVLTDWPGAIEVYTSFGGLKSGGSATPTFPMQVDWQVFPGISCSGPLDGVSDPNTGQPVGCGLGATSGIYDDEMEPPFEAATYLKSANENRGGLLATVGGEMANRYLIRGRILSTPEVAVGTIVPFTLSIRFFPGLPGPARVASAGSFVG